MKTKAIPTPSPSVRLRPSPCASRNAENPRVRGSYAALLQSLEAAKKESRKEAREWVKRIAEISL